MLKVIMLVMSLMASTVSYAGAGFNFVINNNTSSSDGNYPQFTVHTTGGSDCWYDNDIADWNKFAKPGQSVSLYTERKNSLGCFVLFTDPANREVAYFVKENKDSGWKQIGDSFVLFNSGNNESNFFTYGKEPRSYCIEPCFPFEHNQFEPNFGGYLIFSDYQFWAMGTNGSNNAHIYFNKCDKDNFICW